VAVVVVAVVGFVQLRLSAVVITNLLSLDAHCIAHCHDLCHGLCHRP